MFAVVSFHIVKFNLWTTFKFMLSLFLHNELENNILLSALIVVRTESKKLLSSSMYSPSVDVYRYLVHCVQLAIRSGKEKPDISDC